MSELNYQKNKLEKIANAYEDFWINNVQLIDGAIEMLKRLYKKYTLVLVSDAPTSRVVPVLKKFGLEKFFVKIYTPEKYGRKRNLRIFEAVKKGLFH